MTPSTPEGQRVFPSIIRWFLSFKQTSSNQVTTGTPPTLTVVDTAANTDTSATGNANNNFELAPDIQLTNLDGGKFSLKDFRGRVVVLNFWSPRNKASRNEIPTLNELSRVYFSSFKEQAAGGLTR